MKAKTFFLAGSLLSAMIFVSLGLTTLSSCVGDDSTATVTDVDGNVYETVKIGDQIWMAENLRVTRYRNGDQILNIRDSLSWINAVSGALCSYNNDLLNSVTYGYLYNWFAVSDQRNICPEGWRMPTDLDLDILVNHLGGDLLASGKLKAAGTDLWQFPNEGGFNLSGFEALPGGYRFNYETNNPLKFIEGGTFHTLGTNGYWWTTSQSFQMYSWSERLFWGFADVIRDPAYATFGLSVRCIKE